MIASHYMSKLITLKSVIVEKRDRIVAVRNVRKGYQCPQVFIVRRCDRNSPKCSIWRSSVFWCPVVVKTPC